MKNNYQEIIQNGKAILGIELGSTRIKAVLISEDNDPIAVGSHEWENSYENGIWTYRMEEVWAGIQDSYRNLANEVHKKYGVAMTKVAGIGISAMMHGYVALDEQYELLVPFRTWRNTMTQQACEQLTEAFQFHIPQRWSIAHLYQAILNQEEHVSKIAFQTTLAGYVHYMLTGEKVMGIGEASGMFPIDSSTKDYDGRMMDTFNQILEKEGMQYTLQDILPKVLVAGDEAGHLTEQGAKLLDQSGLLEAGIPLCPPEGDAGTGMVATNSVAVRTGNVSAGTSVFAMIVLEQPLQKAYEEIDMVTTPTGEQVAMVHCNNCTSDLNAWIQLFEEVTQLFDVKVDRNELFSKLYHKALEGEADCGGLLAYNYFSGEHITGLEEGRPLFVRNANSRFDLANFMRVHLFTALGALKTGLDLLLKEEQVKVDTMLGHGGFFKTADVTQKIMAGAIDAPVCVMDTASEGGAWGIAILVSYMLHKNTGESLSDYLNRKVFVGQNAVTVEPEQGDVEGFNQFIELYHKGLAIEHSAVKYM